MRFQAADEKKAVVVVHGGYDSFMEEFYLTVKGLPSKGYTVLLFRREFADGLLRTPFAPHDAIDLGPGEPGRPAAGR